MGGETGVIFLWDGKAGVAVRGGIILGEAFCIGFGSSEPGWLATVLWHLRGDRVSRPSTR